MRVKVLEVIRLWRELNVLVDDIKRESDYSIVFSLPLAPELQIYTGIQEVADMLGVEVEKGESGIEAYPVAYRCEFDGVKMCDIEAE